MPLQPAEETDKFPQVCQFPGTIKVGGEGKPKCDAPKFDKCMCAESHIGHILGRTGLY
jgi:hypothetical protein